MIGLSLWHGRTDKLQNDRQRTDSQTDRQHTYIDRHIDTRQTNNTHIDSQTDRQTTDRHSPGNWEHLKRLLAVM